MWYQFSCGFAKENAGLTMLVTIISTSSYLRNLCGETQCPPFTCNTVDTVWDINTIIFWPNVNLRASWICSTYAATTLKQLGQPLLTSSSCLEKYVTALLYAPKVWARIPRAIPCFSCENSQKGLVISGNPKAGASINFLFSCWNALSASPFEVRSFGLDFNRS